MQKLWLGLWLESGLELGLGLGLGSGLGLDSGLGSGLESRSVLLIPQPRICDVYQEQRLVFSLSTRLF